MAAPSMVSRNGDNVLVKSVEAVFGGSDDDGEERDDDSSQEGASGTEEQSELPQCKIKRNYSCASCDYYTQNPRFYLYHQKQVHKEKIKIFECPHCLYASKHSQKLQRHIHMVHVIKKKSSKSRLIKPKPEKVRRKSQSPICEPEQNDGEEKPEPMFAADGTQIYKCSVCDMTSKSQTLVSRHERVVHLKKKFFRCGKCNYMTHMKARYTKHVKYHSMPMIKCDMCDFKTPYKWNLDRHNKNHQGDGAFKCVMCNFTADIKQSLTVHEMNHHVPPVGHVAGNRRRLRVGASDTLGMVTEEDGIDQDELDLLRLEREGSLDQIEQNPADFLQTQLDEITPPPPPPPPMMKFRMRQVLVPVGKMLTDKSQSNNRGLIQIQKYKCKVCEFSGNLGEVQRHEAANHSLNDFSSSLGTIKRAARPIPNLIPIQGQSLLKPASERRLNESNELNSSSSLKDFAMIIDETRQQDLSNGSLNGSEKSDSPTPVDDKKHNDSFKKKNASFFDKLKEKLMTSASERDLICSVCGYEAKCLSEHLRHQKSHDDEEEGNSIMFPTELSSTRCQHCRHRCKTSTDLKVHLQTCPAVQNNLELTQIKTEPEDDDSCMKGLNDEDQEDGNTHPMENKVFVWNNFNANGEIKAPAPFELNFHQRHEENLAMEARQMYVNNTNNRYEEQLVYYQQKETTRKVFKCPSCSFWASTASRFHVHIVGHLNKRPFQCSLCHYSSNWRWDITKHIRLKQMRDSAHEKARVLLTDEAGRRNYSKYNKYLVPISNEEFKKAQQPRRIFPKDNLDSMETKRSSNKRHLEEHDDDDDDKTPKKKVFTENKKTMWKCKKCFFRNGNRGVVLAHVKEHYRDSIHENKTANKQEEYSNFSNDHASPKSERDQEENGNISHPASPPSYENEDTVDHPDFMCETCPYFCDSLAQLEEHAERHFVAQGSNVKCQFCPYYVENSQQLMEHLDLHENSDAVDDKLKNVVFACLQCPYVGMNQQQLEYHRQWHFKNLPHKCSKCNYSTHTNIILTLHVRLHRRTILLEEETVSTKKPETIIAADISGIDTARFPEIPMVWVSKPMGISKMFKCRFCPHVNMRKSNIQEHEKMHASRTPANSSASAQISNSVSVQHHCPDCNYICNNAGVLSSHMKVHQAFFGQVCGVVDHKKSDEEQIQEMKQKVSEYEASLKQKIEEEPPKEPQVDESLTGSDTESKDGLVLHFCPICPARFLFVKEVVIHLRFHDLNLPFKCESCTYTARQKQHLLAHLKVHTDEYQERTTVLCSMYSMDKSYPKPKVAVVLGDNTESVWNWKSDSVWVVVKNNNNNEDKKRDTEEDDKSEPLMCDKCPAEFYKQLALEYHKSLHGGPGQHKCRYCDYAVKTYGNLMRHEAIHANSESPVKLNPKSTEVPTTGTELFRQKTEAQKSSPSKPIPAPTQEDPEFGSLIFGSPDFVYPAYLKNGRLREKRYKCHKCPSAFEKREQYKIHLSLHGSRQRYNCEKCDYSVKYFANYSQHLKKHNLSENMKKEQASGEEPVVEDKEIDETNEVSTTERCGKSLKMSVADQQTMMLMQSRNVSNTVTRDNINGDVISRCPHCPYANNRKDGVSSHIKCHSNSKRGPYVCKFCDYNVPQLHFLREHLKIHFSSIKFVKPDAYMKCERLELWSEPVDSNHNTDKRLVFKDTGLDTKDRFEPIIEYPDEFENIKGRVYINLKTGEEEVEMDDDDEVKADEEEEYEEMETGEVVGSEEHMETEEAETLEATGTLEAINGLEKEGSPQSPVSPASNTSEDNSCDESSSTSSESGTSRTSATNVSQD